MQLADRKTIIRAALTEKSADRLGLKKGKEVLILIKAPWVNIEKGTSLTQQYDNALSGTLTQIETGSENSELVVTLEGGQEVCATCSNQHVKEQKLHINDSVTALFNADQVIVATLC